MTHIQNKKAEFSNTTQASYNKSKDIEKNVLNVLVFTITIQTIYNATKLNLPFPRILPKLPKMLGKNIARRTLLNICAPISSGKKSFFRPKAGTQNKICKCNKIKPLPWRVPFIIAHSEKRLFGHRLPHPKGISCYFEKFFMFFWHGTSNLTKYLKLDIGHCYILYKENYISRQRCSPCVFGSKRNELERIICANILRFLWKAVTVRL